MIPTDEVTKSYFFQRASKHQPDWFIMVYHHFPYSLFDTWDNPTASSKILSPKSSAAAIPKIKCVWPSYIWGAHMWGICMGKWDLKMEDVPCSLRGSTAFVWKHAWDSFRIGWNKSTCLSSCVQLRWKKNLVDESCQGPSRISQRKATTNSFASPRVLWWF
jgi:hypothetical protein